MLILCVLLALALALGAVCLLYRRRGSALRRAARQLALLRGAPGGRLRLAAPDRELEELLEEINTLLDRHEEETRGLREREEGLRRQISNVSHDLRTPLTSILGYLQLLERDDLSPEERSSYLATIAARARTLQTLITAFYDLSRIEGGEYPLQFEAVDLHRVLSDLLAGFYGDFEQRGFTVRVELDGDLPPVRADRNGAVRVLSNLLNNALKHGGQELTVRLYREGDALITSFSNLAPTLTQEDLPHIFDRFYTADQMRTGQNTGLGLAIVKALAQRMGHTVWARLDGQEFTVAVRWKLER